MVPVTMPVAGSTTGVGPEPAGMGVLEPGSVKPVTETVVPLGATPLSSTLPVAGVPALVESVTADGSSSGVAAVEHRVHSARIRGVHSARPCHHAIPTAHIPLARVFLARAAGGVSSDGSKAHHHTTCIARMERAVVSTHPTIARHGMALSTHLAAHRW